MKRVQKISDLELLRSIWKINASTDATTVNSLREELIRRGGRPTFKKRKVGTSVK